MKRNTLNLLKFLGIQIALLLAQPNALGMFVKMSDEQLLDDSSVIVVAEFIGYSDLELGPAGRSTRLGVLKRSVTLKGETTQTIFLIKLASPNAPISSTDLNYKSGDTGLWFLSPTDVKGVFQCNHPQRFVSSAGSPERYEALLAKLRRE